MAFVCTICNKKIEKELIGKKIRCPFCGGKILLKERPKITRRIKTD